MKYFLPFLFISMNAWSVVVSHTCTLEEMKNGGAPCACRAVPVTQPFCPRLEGIKIPCLVQIAPSTCSYEDGNPAEPPPSTCITPKTCTFTTKGACLTSETYDCSHDVRGPCLSWSEGGVCQQYEITRVQQTCTRCLTYEMISVTEANEAKCGCAVRGP